MSNYFNKYYRQSSTDKNSELRVTKSSDSEWVGIGMVVNGSADASITIKSKEQLEALHFMLGQLLSE